jgi:hypothetical protein
MVASNTNACDPQLPLGFPFSFPLSLLCFHRSLKSLDLFFALSASQSLNDSQFF